MDGVGEKENERGLTSQWSEGFWLSVQSGGKGPGAELSPHVGDPLFDFRV